MEAEKIAGYVKVIKVPRGEAPRWVRKSLRGLVVPYTKIIFSENRTLVGVISGKKMRIRHKFLIKVPKKEVLKALKSSMPGKWLKDMIGPEYLIFQGNEVKCIGAIDNLDDLLF